MECRRLGVSSELKIRSKQIPVPDPRTSYAHKDHEVWSYRGLLRLNKRAKTALPDPPQSVQEQLFKIACQPYNLVAWWEKAHEYASKLGTVNVKELLSAMVHPSLPPEGIASWNWIYRLQFASCFTIAHLDSKWKTSLRRQVLLSLLHGTMDWITDAAAITLSQIYLECPESRQEIRSELQAQFRQISREGYCCYERPLTVAYLRIPELGDEEVTEILKRHPL